MRCGNCKGEHASVAQVRTCFNTKPGHPSPKQMSLAQALGREKIRLPEYEGMSEEDYHLAIAALSLKAMGDFLTKMLKQPNSGLSRDELFERVDNGKYALKNEDDDDIRFYCIDGTRHRILWELTGAPGDFKMQRIYRPEKILKRIGDDPVAAFALFGLNVGTCGRCGSPLTQKHTRERGIGDTCYAKLTA
ncbi:hypothetical protein SEA_DRYAD_78 [Streptomyces phage Dryad]|nr:hypothetical protein SEA_DRYAD_78 [Streptomyces phage Dryad]